MSRRQLKAEDVEGYVLAAHDEIRETEMAYGVTVHPRIVFGRRRGEFVLVMVAVKAGEPLTEEGYARAQRNWPTPRATSVHALLYACAMSMNIACQQAYIEEHGHYLGDAPRESR